MSMKCTVRDSQGNVLPTTQLYKLLKLISDGLGEEVATDAASHLLLSTTVLLPGVYSLELCEDGLDG
jgi:hypothetical protein